MVVTHKSDSLIDNAMAKTKVELSAIALDVHALDAHFEKNSPVNRY